MHTNMYTWNKALNCEFNLEYRALAEVVIQNFLWEEKFIIALQTRLGLYLKNSTENSSSRFLVKWYNVNNKYLNMHMLWLY